MERAEFNIAIGAPGFGVLVMWALRGGATSAMPGRAAALPASTPNWRRAESNLERAPKVGVNLESTSASWSQPGVAPKTWSQHLKPGASSLQLERARSNWSELAPSWNEVGASGASEKKFSNVGPSISSSEIYDPETVDESHAGSASNANPHNASSELDFGILSFYHISLIFSTFAFFIVARYHTIDNEIGRFAENGDALHSIKCLIQVEIKIYEKPTDRHLFCESYDMTFVGRNLKHQTASPLLL